MCNLSFLSPSQRCPFSESCERGRLLSLEYGARLCIIRDNFIQNLYKVYVNQRKYYNIKILDPQQTAGGSVLQRWSLEFYNFDNDIHTLR